MDEIGGGSRLNESDERMISENISDKRREKEKGCMTHRFTRDKMERARGRDHKEEERGSLLAIAEQNAIKEQAIMIVVLRLCKRRLRDKTPLTRSKELFC